MSFEIVYSYLIDSAGFFLGSWVVFLLAAYARAFGSDASIHKG
ncbi:MAG TPA: hypothetical protein VKR57_03035 [Terriglobales bacterium]|jgi:hypothetical protein|nr:hypothetical protein [Terriglobales bacterium]